jgi:hypothetical protein
VTEQPQRPAEASAVTSPGAGLSGERGDVATRDGGSPSFPPVASPLNTSPVSRHGGWNPCIYEPARCNGGGYDGCACGPYSPPKRERPYRGGGLV